jgi:hypothetical protein
MQRLQSSRFPKLILKNQNQRENVNGHNVKHPHWAVVRQCINIIAKRILDSMIAPIACHSREKPHRQAAMTEQID